MKITTKGKYALEVMTDLAMHSSQDHRESLKQIASRRGLSEKYLERIMKALKEQGLVLSTRGAYGGYCLARNPDHITVEETLKAVEGQLAPVTCLTEKTDCKIDCTSCSTQDTWRQVWKKMLEVTASVSIGDIVRRVEELEKYGNCIDRVNSM